MNFNNFEKLSDNAKEIVKKENYIGYIRVYYLNGYGSRLFFKGAANGSLADIRKAEEIGRILFTPQIKTEVQILCEELFEGRNPKGRYQLYNFCKEQGFDNSADGYLGYCEMEHTVFQIVVSKSDDYFCRICFYSILA